MARGKGGVRHCRVLAGIIVAIVVRPAPCSAQEDWSEVQRLARKDPLRHEPALARALFDAQEITDAITLLHREYLADLLPSGDLTEALRDYFTRFVRETGGARLRDEALRRMRSGTEEEQWRAQIILARCEPLPAEVCDALLAEGAARLWVYGLLNHPDRASFPAPQPETPWLGDARAYGDRPLEDVAESLRSALEYGPEDLNGFQEEYLVGYRSVCLPVLAKYWEYVPLTQRHAFDLDGDGQNEFWVNTTLPDGWSGQTLTMLLGWDGPAQRWTMRSLRRWNCSEQDVSWHLPDPPRIGDFDGDGRPEIVEFTDLLGNGPCACLRIHDSDWKEPLVRSGERVRLVQNPRTARYAFLASDWESRGIGIKTLTNSLGIEHQVVVLSPGGVVEEARLLTADFE